MFMAPSQNLLTTVHSRLASGELVLDEGTDVESFLKGSKTPHEHNKLYPFEPLIKEMLSQGATYGEIAEKTGVDRHTVKKHIEKYLK